MTLIEIGKKNIRFGKQIFNGSEKEVKLRQPPLILNAPYKFFFKKKQSKRKKTVDVRDTR